MPWDQTDPLGHRVPLGMSPTRHGAHPAPPNVGTATAAMRTPLPLCHPSRHLKVPFWGARALIFPIWLFLFSALQLLGCSKAARVGPCPSVTAVWGQGDVCGGGPGALCLLLAPAPALGLGPSQPRSIPQSGAAPGGCVFGESSSTDAMERHRHAADVPRARSWSTSVPARAAGGGKKKWGWASGRMCPSTQARSATLLQLFQLPKAPRQPPPPLRHCAQISFGESPKPHAAEAPPACRSPAVAKSSLQQLGGFAEGLCAPSCPSCSLKQPS